ncbi:MAG: hypothetical protein Q9167_004016 [Letrouitia subvulpina]
MAPVEESYCDLLIIGAGPAGLMIATWAARCGIHARIIDKRGTKIFNGQADGLQCRSLEIFDSFGFADRVLKEANHLLEICIWNPDETGRIGRTDRIPDTIPGISRFREVVLHQGRIERFFLDSLKDYSSIEVERGVLPDQMDLDLAHIEDQKAHPVTVQVRHLTEEEATPAQKGSSLPDGMFRSNLAKDDTDDLICKSRGKEGKTETIRTKYLVGCDGAHSWTRRQLGLVMEGEQTDYLWGVMDIFPLTDFPDIRMRCAIRSESSGSMMVIPRENRLVRLYIQLIEVNNAGGSIDRSKISPEIIIKAAQKILSPYKITYDYCDWWTAYQIGQRVSNQFSVKDRIFLAGDAVHTHSPKAGQGMNVSMQDAFNLGWKIALVIKGLAKPLVLKTYQSERRRVAQDLIALDHQLSRIYSRKIINDVNYKVGLSEFKEAIEKSKMFASGISVDYGASILTTKPGSSTEEGDGTDVGPKNIHTRMLIEKQNLAENAKIGMRFPSFQVLNQSDARPWQFCHFLKSDGRFRIILFAGNLNNKNQWQRVQALAEELANDYSFLHRFTASAASLDSVVEILTIHSAPRIEVELLDLHEIYHTYDEKRGWEYDKVFVDDESYHEGHGHAYEHYGVDKERGCVVILRPDHHVGWIGELEDVQDMDQYLSEILIPQNHK